MSALLALCTVALLAPAACQPPPPPPLAVGPAPPPYAGAPSCPYADHAIAFPDPTACDGYYRCANGTVTQERCGHGLLFSGAGAVHEHCDYNWRVNCGDRPLPPDATNPAGRGGVCPYAFGLFPTSEKCVDIYVKCVYGEPQPEQCPEGLAYDARVHACNWPDLLPYCSVKEAEQLVGYSCPEQVPAGSASLRFGLYPRFATGQCDRLVTCVNYYPRLTVCEYGKVVDEGSLTCVDAGLVKGCGGRGHGPLPGPGPRPGPGLVPHSGPGPVPGYTGPAGPVPAIRV